VLILERQGSMNMPPIVVAELSTPPFRWSRPWRCRTAVTFKRRRAAGNAALFW
jgi:hypothetical protein